MAIRNFVLRNGKAVNRAHTDKDYPYRYAGDPIRHKAAAMARVSRQVERLIIEEGLADYYEDLD